MLILIGMTGGCSVGVGMLIFGVIEPPRVGVPIEIRGTEIGEGAFVIEVWLNEAVAWLVRVCCLSDPVSESYI